MSSDAPRKPVNKIISNQISSDTAIKSTSKPVNQFDFLLNSIHLYILLATTKQSATINGNLAC
jgi:hypothetical protein